MSAVSDDLEPPFDTTSSGLVVCWIGLFLSLPCWLAWHGIMLTIERDFSAVERLMLYDSCLYVPAVVLGMWQSSRPGRSLEQRYRALLSPPGAVVLVQALLLALVS